MSEDRAPIDPNEEPIEQRLHPISWLFETGKAAKGLLLPAIFVLFASGGLGYEIWATIFIVPAGFAAALKYLAYRYTLSAEEMVVREGILTKKERHIPYARIQNIDLVRNPLHRLLNVALVRVETASGGAPEAVMRVLSLDSVEQMRALVFADRSQQGASATERGAPPASDEEPADAEAAQSIAGASAARQLLHLPAGELARLGIVSNKGLVVVGAALGVLWQTDWWESGWWNNWQDYSAAGREWYDALVASSPVIAALVFLMAVLPSAWLVLRVFSIGWFYVQLHDFTLSRVGHDLRAEYGLLNRVSRTVPTPRIQVLTIREGPLHRRLGRQSVELQTVGGSGIEEMDIDDSSAKVESQWLAPMVAAERVPALLREVMAEVDLDAVRWQPISARAWTRIFKRWVAVAVVATFFLSVFLDPWALAVAVPIIALAYVNARLWVKHAGYALTDWGVLSRRGWWTRVTKIVRYSKIQTVGRERSPFDRRHGMESVVADTAGAEMILHTIDIPYLESQVAEAIGDRLYDEAGRREFTW